MYNCCCADEEKVKAGCSYYCRCPGYRENTDNYESYSDFEPRYSATPFKENEKCRFFGDDEKLKKYRDYRENNENVKGQVTSSDIKLSDLAPDVPFPSHWSQCGQHMTNVANEYRELLNNFKTIQSMAVDSKSKKLRKKFTRTYPSGKEFTFEVKPASNLKKNDKFLNCQCKNCPILVKSLKKIQFSKKPKKSIILDGYNNLVKSLEGKRNDKRFLGKCKKKLRINENSACDCGRKIDDELSAKKCESRVKIVKKNEKLKNQGLGKKKCKTVSINRKSNSNGTLNSMNENLNSVNEKNSKNENLNPENDKVEKNQKLDEINFPRIVRPRGVFCKDDLRKILIYPPHGEEGLPLTLNKKCSNIDCRIKGDIHKGFRYKVTYKQEFLSPIWHPEEKGSPFKKKENSEYG